MPGTVAFGAIFSIFYPPKTRYSVTQRESSLLRMDVSNRSSIIEKVQKHHSRACPPVVTKYAVLAGFYV